MHDLRSATADRSAPLKNAALTMTGQLYWELPTETNEESLSEFKSSRMREIDCNDSGLEVARIPRAVRTVS
jgi:hypothetical protein